MQTISSKVAYETQCTQTRKSVMVMIAKTINQAVVRYVVYLMCYYSTPVKDDESEDIHEDSESTQVHVCHVAVPFCTSPLQG